MTDSAQRLGQVTIAEVLDRAIRSRLARLRVSLPGVIESYDPATRTATVKPLLKETRFDEAGEEHVEALPMVCQVPVQFPGGGGFEITFPVAKGDSCMLLFADRALDKWLASGQDSDPIDLRRHDLSDAVALLGVSPTAGLTAHDAAVMTLGSRAGAADWVALAGKVLDELQAIHTAFNAHTHAVVTSCGSGPGTGTAAAPAAMAPAGPVASAAVKVKG
jgi:hypothetical protein